MQVVRGIQLGLGLSLMRNGVLMVEATGSLAASADCYLTAIACFAAVLALHNRPGAPVALLLVLVGGLLALATRVADGSSTTAEPSHARPVAWALGGVSTSDVSHALLFAALPQLPLTTLNSVVSTCKVSSPSPSSELSSVVATSKERLPPAVHDPPCKK